MKISNCLPITPFRHLCLFDNGQRHIRCISPANGLLVGWIEENQFDLINPLMLDDVDGKLEEAFQAWNSEVQAEIRSRRLSGDNPDAALRPPPAEGGLDGAMGAAQGSLGPVGASSVEERQQRCSTQDAERDKLLEPLSLEERVAAIEATLHSLSGTGALKAPFAAGGVFGPFGPPSWGQPIWASPPCQHRVPKSSAPASEPKPRSIRFTPFHSGPNRNGDSFPGGLLGAVLGQTQRQDPAPSSEGVLHLIRALESIGVTVRVVRL